MSLLSLSRISGLLIVAVAIATIKPFASFSAIVFSLTLTHYALSFWYSRFKISQQISTSNGTIKLIFLSALGTILYFVHSSLAVWFGLHLVFNEVYVSHKTRSGEYDPRGKQLRLSAIILNLLSYCTILRHTPPFNLIHNNTLIVMLGTAAIFYFVSLVQERLKAANSSSTGRPSLIDICLIETIGLLAAAASFYVNIQLIQILLYHIVVWTFYPLLSLAKQGKDRVIAFSILNVVLSVVFIMISPISGFIYHVPEKLFMEQFFFWSFIHITTSFALSSAHPSWIRRLLQTPLKSTLSLQPNQSNETNPTLVAN